MRAERLLSVLMLLRSKGHMTAAELALELEVSERTILRDIEALSLSGVPVYAERGRHGGFALVQGYRTDLSGLTLPEAIALLSGGGRIDSAAAASAKRKLAASLPEVHRGGVAEANQRILVRPEGFVRPPQQLEALAPVQQAVFEGRRVRLVYERRGGVSAERVLDPIGLIVAGDTWYLVAASEGVERMYRVSRMSGVVVLDDPAQREPSVDLEEVWERHRAAFRSTFDSVDVVIDCVASDVERISGFAEVVTRADTAGGFRLQLSFADRNHAMRVLWMGYLESTFRIVEPEWIRDGLHDRAGVVAQMTVSG
ncbi:WYL domain-containing protein [Streptomyces sp. SID6673]|nr:WYL domain-containing protein [Streptomyces sp. SID11726]NEB23968.1 WYL domain-containing protein [Streptomyces sp. SID6673]